MLSKNIPTGLFLLCLMILAIYIRVNGVSKYYYSEDEAFHIAMAKGEGLKQVLGIMDKMGCYFC